MKQVQYRKSDRAILAHGLFPDFDPDDPDVGVAEVGDDAPLGEAGQKFLRADGTVRVVPPDPPTQAEIDREENRRKLFAADLLVLKNRLANTTVPWEKATIRMIGRLLGEVYDQ